MTGYSGRRGPNVSQFLANLNTTDQPANEDIFPGHDDLSLFASTDFFDFDMGDSLNNVSRAEFDINTTDSKSRTDGWQGSTSSPEQDFLNPDFAFSSLPGFSGNGASADTSANATFNYSIPQSQIASPTSPTSPTSASANTGEKRKSTTASIDDTARLAAEEDKRRRNTAASARFRVKKKQREQALEKTAKEMSAKAAALETKVNQLEMENKWLKSLITDRDFSGEKGVVGKSNLDELWEKYKREERSKSSETQASE